jgi:hypothetical protein
MDKGAFHYRSMKRVEKVNTGEWQAKQLRPKLYTLFSSRSINAVCQNQKWIDGIFTEHNESNYSKDNDKSNSHRPQII